MQKQVQQSNPKVRWPNIQRNFKKQNKRATSQARVNMLKFVTTQLKKKSEEVCLI